MQLPSLLENVVYLVDYWKNHHYQKTRLKTKMTMMIMTYNTTPYIFQRKVFRSALPTRTTQI